MSRGGDDRGGRPKTHRGAGGHRPFYRAGAWLCRDCEFEHRGDLSAEELRRRPCPAAAEDGP